MNAAQREELRQATLASRGHPVFARQWTAYTRPNYTTSTVSGTTGYNQSEPMDLSAIDLDDDVDRLYHEVDQGSTLDQLYALQFNNRRGSSSMGRTNTRAVPGLSREDYDRLSRERKCFNCQEEGHLARNCRKPRNGKKGTQATAMGQLK